jgi:prepilin-type N-terminal cleavage/methylation domain-containing protein
MNMALDNRAQARTVKSRGQKAFTLVEMMVAVGVFTLVLIGLIYAHLFGMRCDELVNSKLGASESARRSFDLLTSDIRSAKTWRIGNGSSSNFKAISNTVAQVGNAIQITFNASDTNTWVRYYFDTNLCQLCRMHSSNAVVKIMAQNLTNTTGSSMTFAAQDYQGNQKYDLQYKYVIVTTMEYAEYQYPLTKVGPGYRYNYYRMQFKTASHNYN